MSQVVPPEPDYPLSTRTDRYGEPLPKHALLRLGATSHYATNVAFSPDRRLAALNQSDRVALFDRNGLRFVRALRVPYGQLTVMRFLGDDTIVGADHFGDFHRFSIASGEHHRFEMGGDARNGRVRDVFVLPDGRCAVAAYQSIRFVKGEHAMSKAINLKSWINQLAYGDEILYAACDVGVVAIPLSTLTPEKISEGRLVAWAGGRIAWSTWDAVHIEGHPVAGIKEEARALAFSPDGATLYVALRSGLAIIDARTRTKVHTVQPHHDGGAWHVFVSPDGDWLVTREHANHLSFHRTSDYAPLFEHTLHRNYISGAALCGDRWITADFDGQVRVWENDDLSSTKKMGTSPLLDGFSHFAIVSNAGAIEKVDFASAFSHSQILPANKVRRAFHDMRIAPDGVTFAVAGTGGVSVHQMNGKTVWAAASNEAVFARYSPDGSLLVAGGRAHPLTIYDAQTGAVQCTLEGTMHPPNGALFFTAEGELRLVTCGVDTIVWNAANGTLLSRHAFGVSLADQQGRFFVNRHGLIRPSDGAVLFSRPGRAIFLSRDGRRLAFEERHCLVVYDVDAMLTDAVSPRPTATFASTLRLRMLRTDAPKESKQPHGIDMTVPETVSIAQSKPRGFGQATWLLPGYGAAVTSANEADLEVIWVIATNRNTNKSYRMPFRTQIPLGRAASQRPTNARPRGPWPEESSPAAGPSTWTSREKYYLNLVDLLGLPDKPAVYDIRLEHTTDKSITSNELSVTVTR